MKLISKFLISESLIFRLSPPSVCLHNHIEASLPHEALSSLPSQLLFSKLYDNEFKNYNFAIKDKSDHDKEVKLKNILGRFILNKEELNKLFFHSVVKSDNKYKADLDSFSTRFRKWLFKKEIPKTLNTKLLDLIGENPNINKILNVRMMMKYGILNSSYFLKDFSRYSSNNEIHETYLPVINDSYQRKSLKLQDVQGRWYLNDVRNLRILIQQITNDSNGTIYIIHQTPELSGIIEGLKKDSTMVDLKIKNVFLGDRNLDITNLPALKKENFDISEIREQIGKLDNIRINNMEQLYKFSEIAKHC